jgi:hypothetical protein
MQCYRLYTKAYFDRTMPDVTPPEIQRTSLAGAVLHLKSLALDIDVLNFDFLDAPSKESLEVSRGSYCPETASETAFAWIGTVLACACEGLLVG